jgi:hypothetical protein
MSNNDVVYCAYTDQADYEGRHVRLPAWALSSDLFSLILAKVLVLQTGRRADE